MYKPTIMILRADAVIENRIIPKELYKTEVMKNEEEENRKIARNEVRIV